MMPVFDLGFCIYYFIPYFTLQAGYLKNYGWIFVKFNLVVDTEEIPLYF